MAVYSAKTEQFQGSIASLNNGRRHCTLVESIFESNFGVSQLKSKQAFIHLVLLCCATWVGSPSLAADIVVKISGIQTSDGQVGCSLFSNAKGFPQDTSVAKGSWKPADPKGMLCRFPNEPEGVYAIAIGHDLNGNQKVDANFLGMPKEPWGVSNNMRSALRAPTFEEASFKVKPEDKEVVINITISQ